jgi:hypothetical protein
MVPFGTTLRQGDNPPKESTEALRWPPVGGGDSPESVQYARGTVFAGTVTGFWEFQKHTLDRSQMELRDAEWVCLIEDKPTGTLSMLSLFGSREELWFRASDVEIGYRRSQRGYERLEMLRKLTEQSADGG